MPFEFVLMLLILALFAVLGEIDKALFGGKDDWRR